MGIESAMNSLADQCERRDREIERLTRERDEARAEVERLQTASVASVDRWMEFVSHFQRLVKSNMGPEAGKIAIGYFKRAAEAGNLDEDGPPTVTPRDAAASERAAIVAMLHNEAFHLSAQADVTDDGYDANTMDDQARALRAAAERITRLDHHRETGKERGEETAAALRAAPKVAGEWTYGCENWDGWVRVRSGAPLRFPLAQVQGDEATGFHWKVDAPEIEAYGSGPATLHDAQEACDFELRQAGWVLL